jgi:hypothetical protein
VMREAGGGDGAIEEFCSICKLSRLERFPRAEDWTSQRILLEESIAEVAATPGSGPVREFDGGDS